MFILNLQGCKYLYANREVIIIGSVKAITTINDVYLLLFNAYKY